MPKGGIRPRNSDGSTEHLLKSKWKLGQTKTIRVPVVLTKQLLELAHKLDNGDSVELSQDNNSDLERMKSSQQKAITLLQLALKEPAKQFGKGKQMIKDSLALLEGHQ